MDSDISMVEFDI